MSAWAIGLILRKPYILMMQHPVTTTPEEGRAQVEKTLAALKDRKEQKIVMWPNIDAGSDLVSRGIRIFRENNSDSNFAYCKNFRRKSITAF